MWHYVSGSGGSKSQKKKAFFNLMLNTFDVKMYMTIGTEDVATVLLLFVTVLIRT